MRSRKWLRRVEGAGHVIIRRVALPATPDRMEDKLVDSPVTNDVLRPSKHLAVFHSMYFAQPNFRESRLKSSYVFESTTTREQCGVAGGREVSGRREDEGVVEMDGVTAVASRGFALQRSDPSAPQAKTSWRHPGRTAARPTCRLPFLVCPGLPLFAVFTKPACVMEGCAPHEPVSC